MKERVKQHRHSKSALHSPYSPTHKNSCTKVPTKRNRVLYVGNLQVQPRDYLLSMFKFYGRVKRLWVAPCKTFAFVEYVDSRDAHLAKIRLNGRTGRGGSVMIANWADVQP